MYHKRSLKIARIAPKLTAQPNGCVVDTFRRAMGEGVLRGAENLVLARPGQAR